VQIPGTKEWKVMEVINSTIRQSNKDLRDSGYTGRQGIQRERKPQHQPQWKYISYKRSEGGGIDGVYHAERV
jgi:hypothetical protein